MDFSQALLEMKAGKLLTREAWKGNRIRVAAQFPDEGSANTKPYLYMLKGTDRFPIDLSCESLFAEDWKEFVEEGGE